MECYKNIVLESVENGYILRCTKEKKEGNGTYDIPMYKPMEFVYQENQVDDAVKKMKELRAYNKKEKKEYESEED